MGAPGRAGDAGIGVSDQHEAEANRRCLAGIDTIDTVHEIEQVEEPDPKEHGNYGVKPRRQPALKDRARRQSPHPNRDNRELHQ